MPDENLKWTEDGHSNADPPLRVDGPHLPIPASQQTSDNILPESTTHTSIEAINHCQKILGKASNAREYLRSQKFCLEHHTKGLLKVKKNRKQVT
jgi:hypothetical protein